MKLKSEDFSFGIETPRRASKLRHWHFVVSLTGAVELVSMLRMGLKERPSSRFILKCASRESGLRISWFDRVTLAMVENDPHGNDLVSVVKGAATVRLTRALVESLANAIKSELSDVAIAISPNDNLWIWTGGFSP